jgi:ribonuclease VapC
MLIDTSVLVAIYNKEDGFQELLRVIAVAKRRWLSVASYLEFVMVTKNFAWLDGLVKAAEIELLDVSRPDVENAVKGFFRFGRGMHPAKLNYGDCLVYGTAKATGANLLFTGNDFSQTDVTQAPVDGEETS